MAEPKLIEIARLLLENTATGGVRWEKTATKGEFQTSFADYAIMIRGPSSEPSLYLSDEDGDIVEELTSYDVYKLEAENLLGPLYEAARRRALGADEALDQILSILRSGKKKA